jgi:hypothetical protein
MRSWAERALLVPNSSYHRGNGSAPLSSGLATFAILKMHLPSRAAPP